MLKQIEADVVVGRTAAAGLVKDGHVYIVHGNLDQKYEALRWPGREAADLLTGLDFHDAAELVAMIREKWPEACGSACQCHACCERRDRDAEMRTLSDLPRPVPKPVKPVSLWSLFFEWLVWGK